MLLSVTAIVSIAQVEDSKVINNGGSGDYKAIASTETTLTDYVVYRPGDIQAAAGSVGSLPILVFANGGMF